MRQLSVQLDLSYLLTLNINPNNKIWNIKPCIGKYDETLDQEMRENYR